MIQLNRHIEILLLTNDCVIIPGFGGFVTHHVNARYDEEDNMFLPPLRTLGFNPLLQLNDHLLVQSYIEAYDISYPEALQRIEAEVEELKQHLETDGEYELVDIGVLRLNEDGNYEFNPCEAGILTPHLYGLGAFEIKKLEEIPVERTIEIAKVENKLVASAISSSENNAEDVVPAVSDDADKAIVIKMSWIRNIAVAAAAMLLFLVSSTPVSNSIPENEIQQSSILPLALADSQDIKEQSSDSLDNINVENADSATILTDSVTTEKESGTVYTNVQVVEKNVAIENVSYTVVLASQTPLCHAEEYIARLAKANIKDAKVMQMNNTEKVRVVLGSFDSEQSAYEQLRKLRQQSDDFCDAWVLKVKE